MAQKVEIAWKGADLIGESPFWDSEAGHLWWSDIDGRVLHRLHPQSSDHRTYAVPGRVGSFVVADDNRLLLAMEHGFAWFDSGDGSVEPIVDVEADRPQNRFNDGRCDRQGRFLAGSMNLAHDGPTASLWRVDRQLSPTTVCDGVSTANGLAFSPDGRRMWWADSPSERIFTFDYDTADGVPFNKRLWLDRGHAPGRPDGAAVDAEGCYWSARWRGGCLARFAPDGRLDRLIELPVSQVTMCAFGGPCLATLFVTTACSGLSGDQAEAEPLAGSLFAVQPDVKGIPEPRFRSGKGPGLPLPA